MAKRKPQQSGPGSRIAEINLLLSKAEDETTSPPAYANQVQIAVAPEEVTIDFYRTGPMRGHVSKEPHVAFVQRIIMPAGAATRFAEAFAELFKAANQENPETPE